MPADLTRERILEAAEDVLRRYGPAKATVVDVARVLGVSHGSVYRHFPSKAALRDAVAERWLDRMMPPLAAIASEAGPAPERLHRWLEALIAGKRRKVLDDPELFAAYHQLAMESREVVGAHMASLTAQVRQIIADGQAQGIFAVTDPAASARAVLSATSRFHHPVHASEWADSGIDAVFDGVWHLILGGLKRSELHPDLVSIRPYQLGDAQAFHDLNLAWLTAFFHVEAKDKATLTDPEGAILAPGGQIFMAQKGGVTVGCVALLAMGDGVYEVAKMAVTPEVQGRGVGRRLLEAAIDWAGDRGARRLYLESNSRLTPALRLYESVGFRHLPPERRPVSPYARADVFMEMLLADTSG